MAIPTLTTTATIARLAEANRKGTVLLDGLHRRGTLAYGRRHPLGKSRAQVADGEEASGQAQLEVLASGERAALDNVRPFRDLIGRGTLVIGENLSKQILSRTPEA